VRENVGSPCLASTSQARGVLPTNVNLCSTGDVEDPSLFEGEDLPDSDEEDEESDEDDEEAGAGVADAALFQDLGDEDLPSDSDEDDPDYKP